MSGGSDGYDVQVGSDWYGENYDSPDRLLSYGEQIGAVVAHAGPGVRLLEIGIGNGTVTAALRARGLDVVTADFDSDLRPDVVADVRGLPFPDNNFDGVLAFEILEHVPWDDVPTAFGELRRVAAWALVSVPNVGPVLSLRARLPNGFQIARLAARRRVPLRDAIWALSQREAWKRAGGVVSRLGVLGPFRDRPHVFDGQHHWVLGEGGVEAEDFMALARSCGLSVRREFRPVAVPWHHFFLLERDATATHPFG
jgi:SAM-dependent methyltransferase